MEGRRNRQARRQAPPVDAAALRADDRRCDRGAEAVAGVSRLSRVRALAAPHPALWAMTLAILAADAAWLAGSPIALDPVGVAATATVFAGLFAGAAFWALWVPVPTLFAMALASAFLVAFTSAVGVLHYGAASLALPLVDARLAAAEAALGFDWRAHLAFLKAHPALAEGLALAYHSSPLQVALVVIMLAASYRFARLWAFARMFAITLLIAVAISAVAPAAGAYAYYAPDVSADALTRLGGVWHLDHLAVLRGGSAGTIPLEAMRGLVTFPSFHACLAVITAWALAPVRVLGPLAGLLNAAVVVATIGAGGHYLPDVLAGTLLGLAAVAAHRALRRRPRVRQGGAATVLPHGAIPDLAGVRDRQG